MTGCPGPKSKTDTSTRFANDWKPSDPKLKGNLSPDKAQSLLEEVNTATQKKALANMKRGPNAAG